MRKFISNIYWKLVKKKMTEGVMINKGHFNRGSNVSINSCDISVCSKSSLIIEDNVSLSNYYINLNNGKLVIKQNTYLDKGYNYKLPCISIDNGSLEIGRNCIIKSDFSIRFGGICKIGNYTTMNEETEIRCDECIEIGDFNMISYQCNIYDTNTHCTYPSERRREITVNDFPNIGIERERPKTKPVIIKNDCWIGKRATVLKGVTVGNNSIVGIEAVVTKDIPDNSLAFGNPCIIKPKN